MSANEAWNRNVLDADGRLPETGPPARVQGTEQGSGGVN